MRAQRSAADAAFTRIGGFAVPTDDRRPLETPRGFADAAEAVALLHKVAGDVERDNGTLPVPWGDVLRFRRSGTIDLPGNGAPSSLGAVRTINVGPFVNGKLEANNGDTYVALIEFTTPMRAEGLLSYGNWSKAGSPHVGDQMQLLSRKELRPIWRDRTDAEAHLEAQKLF